MLSNEIVILLITAASIGFFHTLMGPDHYIPFVAMAKSGKWSIYKTTWVTILCGIGHVLSSVILGFIGIALGIAVKKLEIAESFRGSIAAWVLIAFGFVYFAWGLRRAFKEHIHGHSHAHADETKNMTPWILFTIFVFGPCEPLIPILMYPAARNSRLGLILVTSVFAAVTILTMLAVVITLSLGIARLPLNKIERYTHALAGATICLCGIAIQFFGM